MWDILWMKFVHFGDKGRVRRITLSRLYIEILERERLRKKNKKIFWLILDKM